MAFTITQSKEHTSISHDLRETVFQHVQILSRGVKEADLERVHDAYKNETLKELCNSFVYPTFILIIIDAQENKLIVINDKFATNKIFYKKSNQEILVSDNIRQLVVEPRIATCSFYEMLTFYTIVPPDTIYEDVYTIGLGSYVVFDSLSVTHTLYWDPRVYKSKHISYQDQVEHVRNTFLKVIREQGGQEVGVALSGGIDSGGILGMLRAVHKQTVPTITFGGRGEKTPDIESSRKTAEENGVVNTEIFPTLEKLKQLPVYMHNLSQPVAGDVVFPNGLILEKAKTQHISTLYFGFGAEMLLGNLKIVRMYDRLWFEKIVPNALKKFIYKTVAPLFSFSQNQIDFLMAQSWVYRFMRARGPLFTRESHLYSRLPRLFEVYIAQKLEKIIGGRVQSTDDLIMLYTHGWVNYLQLRDQGELANPMGISTFSPFDTPEVAEALLSTPHRYRRINGWNKQLLRDVMRPFVSDRLYVRKGRSLIVPYTDFFNGVEELFIKYLSDTIVAQFIDLESFKKEYRKLPEPGLLLMRLISFGVWYDTQWNEKGIDNFLFTVDEALKRRAAE